MSARADSDYIRFIREMHRGETEPGDRPTSVDGRTHAAPSSGVMVSRVPGVAEPQTPAVVLGRNAAATGAIGEGGHVAAFRHPETNVAETARDRAGARAGAVARRR